jgi:hypothetical protein
MEADPRLESGISYATLHDIYRFYELDQQTTNGTDDPSVRTLKDDETFNFLKLSTNYVLPESTEERADSMAIPVVL